MHISRLLGEAAMSNRLRHVRDILVAFGRARPIILVACFVPQIVSIYLNAGVALDEGNWSQMRADEHG